MIHLPWTPLLKGACAIKGQTPKDGSPASLELFNGIPSPLRALICTHQSPCAARPRSSLSQSTSVLLRPANIPDDGNLLNDRDLDGEKGEEGSLGGLVGSLGGGNGILQATGLPFGMNNLTAFGKVSRFFDGAIY